jgi:DNA helicase-2/ATP-dependent DNA helicase PcrA
LNDKGTRGDFLRHFRQTYLTDFPDNQISALDGDITTVSLDRYDQPEVTSEVEKKIKRLQRITATIEKNLIESAGTKDVEKRFKIDYEKSLNEMQYIAATTIERPLLVIAGAGSGKTRTIVYRVAYLLENKIPPQKILLLTFTRKAADEMLARTAALLHDMQCQKVTGGTFHSFANYLLRKYAKPLHIAPNFTIIDTVDSEDVIDLIRQELHYEKKNRAFPRKSRVQTIISKARNCTVTIKSVIDREFKGLTEFTKHIELIAQTYKEYKKAHSLFDYDDLLEFLRDALKTNLLFRERVQETYRYIMVDEFQDTNTIQKEIVDLIAEKYRNVMVVGDDAQSIYAFRGANFENILRFPETYPDCTFIRIEQNYRSNQDILNFTNSVINNALIGYKKELFSTKIASGKPIVKQFYHQDDEAEYIVSKILELREREIPLDQIAVLFRASYHSNYIQAELLRRNIPYVVYGGIRFIERRHVKDIIGYLRIILNPLDPVSWNRVLKLIPGIGDVAASKIVLQVRNAGGKIDFSGFANCKYSADLKKLAQILNRSSQPEVAIAHKIEILKKYYAPILASIETDYEIRLLDIDVLHSLAAKYDDLEKFLSDFALDPPSNRYQDHTQPLINETEEKPLTLSTVHSAKGLEWNCVFVPHLLDGLFPSALALGDIEGIEEERRLFYVACTRAKEQLYLTMPSNVASWDAVFTLPSRFLVEVEKEKYELPK